MKKLLLVSIAAIAAAGCGGGSSNSSTCDNWVNAANGLMSKLSACGITTTINMPASTSSTCSAAISSCNSNDQQLLNNAASCLNGVSSCGGSQTATTFGTAVENCVTPLDGISAACQAAASGTGGTGGTGSNSALGSCSITGACIDYGGIGATSAQVQQGCQQATGTYSSGACSTANRVGTCTVSISGTSLVEYIRFYPPFTAQTAQSGCTSSAYGAMGAWTSG